MNSAMLNLRSAGKSGQLITHGSYLLHFDAQAQAGFNEWYVVNEEWLRSKDIGPAEQSHFSKYRSLAPGLALLFHLLEGHDGDVCFDCLVGALRFAGYLKSHAKRVYGAVHGADGTSAHALVGRLVKGELPSGFTLRSVYTKGWRDLSNKDKVKQGLDQLVELGWLKERHVETGGRGTVEYDINPYIPKQ
jgi:putative DNA primase/helicase